MKELPLNKAFMLLEPGPVLLVTTADKGNKNIMTICWHMVMDFTPRFALLTGPWNYSYKALVRTKECVLAIPAVDLSKKTIDIGMCSGANTDKFTKFRLTALKAKSVGAPLIKECLANIECRVVDLVTQHSIVVLEGVAAWFDPERTEKKTLHAVGDGTFVVDGRRIDRRKMMASKLPDGL